MGRSSQLSAKERTSILLLSKKGFNQKQIAEKTKRSTCVVSKFLKDPLGYGTKKSPGRPSTLSIYDKRKIWRLAKTGEKSAKQIKLEAGINVGVRQILKVIRENKEIVFKKMKKGPKLTNQHKKNCKTFAAIYYQKPATWNRVIFQRRKNLTLMDLMETDTTGMT